MIRKAVFILAHEIGDLSFYSSYSKLRKNQWRSYEALRRDQEKLLKHLISFSYEQVPYYRSLFKSLGLLPRDIRSIKDLEQLPVLTKETIKSHWEDFKPASLSSMRYYSRATGGSTGIPLQYRLSNHDRYLNGAMDYRGWGYGGYNLGDRMVFLAGTSLDVGTRSQFVTKADEIARNIRKLSSFDMGEFEMRQYANTLTSIHPPYMRGYASSIYYLARWFEHNDVTVPALHAIFTTAERLYPNMRKTIGEIFGCEVYDTYGLNDGGVTAFECSEHSGLHVDTERSIMEVVDPDHHQLSVGEGEVLATSLHNYAMPFIRYSTGDLATLRDDDCPCGRHYRLLDEIVGREKEMLVTPTGRAVHGAALINLIYVTLERSAFPDVVNLIHQYQIVQKVKEKIEIRLVCKDRLPDDVLHFIQQHVSGRFDGWQVEFTYVDAIEQSRAGKYKFIVNEVVADA